MAQVINTNIASLNAQRNLNRSQSSLQTSLQRLSSGLRINSAKDDAAGLAISERMTTQIRGLNQAIRNANDGISFAQTAEGALSTVGDALQRIRELAVQSVNDSNSSSDRQALNNEVQALIAEVNRVAAATEFNGQKILDGSLSTLVFQVGANQNQTISVSGVDARGSQLGAAVSTGNSALSSNLQSVADANDVLTINGRDINLSNIDNGSGADIDLLIDQINLISADTGVQAQKASTTQFTLTYSADNNDVRTVTINNVQISVGAGTTRDELITAINDVSAQTGVTATAGAGTGDVVFTSNNGADVTIAQDADPDSTSSGTTTDLFSGVNGGTAGTAGSVTYQAGIVLASDVGTSPTITLTTSGSLTVADLGVSTTFTDNVLSNVNVLTGANATAALQTVDFALQQINGLRAELGAVQTRFESSIANLSVTVENLEAARSRIRDADFAQETANLTRAQILQQAGVAMLAQANVLPQNVLALLQ